MTETTETPVEAPDVTQPKDENGGESLFTVIVAGGANLAIAVAKLVGGLLAGAAYNNSYYNDDYYTPVYYRRCHIESRKVGDYYGWHWERVKVCY